MEVDHLYLCVPDQLEAAEWCLKSLGIEILQPHFLCHEVGGPLMIASDGGSAMLALFAVHSPAGYPLAGFIRAAFRVSAEEFIGFMHSAGDWRDPPLDTYSIQDHNQSISFNFEDIWGSRL